MGKHANAGVSCRAAFAQLQAGRNRRLGSTPGASPLAAGRLAPPLALRLFVTGDVGLLLTMELQTLGRDLAGAHLEHLQNVVRGGARNSGRDFEIAALTFSRWATSLAGILGRRCAPSLAQA